MYYKVGDIVSYIFILFFKLFEVFNVDFGLLLFWLFVEIFDLNFDFVIFFLLCEDDIFFICWLIRLFEMKRYSK